MLLEIRRRRRRRRRRTEEEEEAAGAELKTKTPHKDVGNKRFLATFVSLYMCHSYVILQVFGIKSLYVTPLRSPVLST